jgi:hypothetical protein
VYRELPAGDGEAAIRIGTAPPPPSAGDLANDDLPPAGGSTALARD